MIALSFLALTAVLVPLVWWLRPRSPLVPAVIALFALGPIVLGLLASGVATVFGCALNESGTNPCVVAGVDLGPVLVDGFVAMWFMLLTLPAGALLVAVWFATRPKAAPRP